MRENWRIQAMEPKYLEQSLDMVEQSFTDWADQAEGSMVCRLVEEIRRKEYYVPELELIMVDTEQDEVIGYAMFSRFHLEGKYDSELLILTPVAVKTQLQRRHISRDLIEYGLDKARELGCTAVIVEGDPRNYRARGFVTSSPHGIVPGPSVCLPAVECLMVKELVPGTLGRIRGEVDYRYYEALG